MAALNAAVFTVILLLAWGAAAEQPLYLLEFVFMAEQRDLDDRDDYNALAMQVAARHGVELRATLDLELMALGPGTLDRLDIWSLPDPEALSAWGQDPDYQAMKPVARAIHDYTQLTLYFGSEVIPPRIEPGQRYYAELFTFNKQGFKGEEFADYIRDSDIIAGEYGLRRVASFGNVSRVAGNGPQAHWLNLYYVPSPQNFDAWHNNARFKAMAPTRQRLFDLPNSMLAVFRAR